MTQEEIDAEQALIRKQSETKDFYLEASYEMSVLSGEMPSGGLTDEQVYSVTPFDLLNNDNYTDRKTRDSRLDICKGCDRLFKPTRTCKECGCFMAIKTWLADAHCPKNLW